VEKYGKLGVEEREAKRRLRHAVIPAGHLDLIRRDGCESLGDALTPKQYSIAKYLF